MKKLDELKQLTDKYGLDRAYDAANCRSIIDNTVYISVTQIGRASDWYVDITKVRTFANLVPIVHQYKSFMFGMQALPCVRDFARKFDAALPYYQWL